MAVRVREKDEMDYRSARKKSNDENKCVKLVLYPLATAHFRATQMLEKFSERGSRKTNLPAGNASESKI